MTLLSGTTPHELAYVYLALAPLGLGMGGGVWDPNTVREWPEQQAEDVWLVIDSITAQRRTAGTY